MQSNNVPLFTRKLPRSILTLARLSYCDILSGFFSGSQMFFQHYSFASSRQYSKNPNVTSHDHSTKSLSTQTCDACAIPAKIFSTVQAPPTRIRVFLSPQLFRCGYGFPLHASEKFADKSATFRIRSPEWLFLNTLQIRSRVNGRIRIFSNTLTHRYAFYVHYPRRDK